MTRHYHVSLLALLAVAVGLVWWFARDDGMSLALERLWASGHQEAQTAGKFHAQLADSSRKVAAAVHAAQRLARDTGALRHTQDTALARVQALTLLVDSAHRAPLTQAVQVVGDACHAVEENCEHRVGRFAQALETEHATRLLLAARVGHADSLIAAGVQLGDTKHFRLAFLTLPKPRKWLVAALGCSLGAYIDQADRLRGCGIGAAGLAVASPTQ